MRVNGPDGRHWRLGRRWLPWRPRSLVRTWPGGDFLTAGLDLSLVGLAILLLVLVPVLGIVVLLAIEWLVALAVLPFLALLRAVLPVPWLVVARGADPSGVVTAHTARVRGWRPAGAAVRAAADEIRRYGEPRSLVRERRPREAAGGADGGVDPAMVAREVRQCTVFAGQVRGFDSPFAVDGWLGGYLIAESGRLVLSQDPEGVLARRELPVGGCREVDLRVDPARARAPRDHVVVAFTAADGQGFQIAVPPPCVPLVAAVLCHSAQGMGGEAPAGGDGRECARGV